MELNFKDKDCVYAWIHNGKIVYIGKTKNIHYRISQHITQMHIQSKKQNMEKKYSYLKKHRNEINIEIISNNKKDEYKLIKKHKPILNVQWVKPTLYGKSINKEEQVKKQKEWYKKRDNLRKIYKKIHNLTWIEVQKVSYKKIKREIGGNHSNYDAGRQQWT